MLFHDFPTRYEEDSDFSPPAAISIFHSSLLFSAVHIDLLRFQLLDYEGRNVISLSRKGQHMAA